MKIWQDFFKNPIPENELICLRTEYFHPKRKKTTIGISYYVMIKKGDKLYNVDKNLGEPFFCLEHAINDNMENIISIEWMKIEGAWSENISDKPRSFKSINLVIT